MKNLKFDLCSSIPLLSTVTYNPRVFGNPFTEFESWFRVWKREDNKKNFVFRESAKGLPKRVQERKQNGQGHGKWHPFSGVSYCLLSVVINHMCSLIILRIPHVYAQHIATLSWNIFSSVLSSWFLIFLYNNKILLFLIIFQVRYLSLGKSFFDICYLLPLTKLGWLWY